MSRLFLFVGGGSVGDGTDQDGRPVVEGKWYVARHDDERCIAGPFDDVEEARARRDGRPWSPSALRSHHTYFGSGG